MLHWRCWIIATLPVTIISANMRVYKMKLECNLLTSESSGILLNMIAFCKTKSLNVSGSQLHGLDLSNNSRFLSLKISNNNFSYAGVRTILFG